MTTEFPIADRPVTAPAAATAPTASVLVTPGDDVPLSRVETRARIGPSTTPMVEIDGDGTVHFVGGDWFPLTGFTKPGAAPLRALAARTIDADQLGPAIAAAIGQGTPRVFNCDIPAGSGPTYLKVLPIPSPTIGGQMHALVGLSGSDDLSFRQARPSAARHPIAEA